MFWWLMKYVLLGPVLRLMYRPTTEGLENLPAQGGGILAANHLSFLDNVLLPLAVKQRRVVLLTKVEHPPKWYLSWFFKSANLMPLPSKGDSASEALRGAVQALREGALIGVFPEATRSPDGRLYRGKTAVARLTLEAQVPVVPVALRGTREAWPPERRLPKPGRVAIRFGKPLRFDRRHEKPRDPFVLRSVADEIMHEIMSLSGQEYVDEYAPPISSQTAASASPQWGRSESAPAAASPQRASPS